MTDRLRVNNLVLKVASWVSSAIARRVELWDDTLVIPPALAARAAVFAFGDELIDLELPGNDSQWLSQGGRDMAAAYLLPRAEAALRQELQRPIVASPLGSTLRDRLRLAEPGPESEGDTRLSLAVLL